MKILEEVHELFQVWKESSSEDVLKESADALEIVLHALELWGYKLDDLLYCERVGIGLPSGTCA